MEHHVLTRAELTGTYIRYLGTRANGSLINSATHSMQYTETGSTPYSCDVFYPGSPYEGFTVEATGAVTVDAPSTVAVGPGRGNDTLFDVTINETVMGESGIPGGQITQHLKARRNA